VAGVRTLVISDLHLGSALGRDVLRRPLALAALTEALRGIDRLVLLGDTVELLEGRPRRALAQARIPLGALARALGPGSEVVVVPGNHDHALVRPWLRRRRAEDRPLGLATRVPVGSSPALEALAAALRPARVRVQYPGAWLGEGTYATHGHYVDRHLLPRAKGVLARGPLALLPERGARPDDYERSGGPSLDAMGSAVAVELPDALASALEVATGGLRRASIAAAPALSSLLRTEALAPFTAGALGFQFRRAGLPAMAAVAEALHLRAREILFGHLHRTGPLPGDEPADWHPQERGPRLYNSGSWVFEPLLLAGATPPHPYWPGGAVLLEHGAAPRVLTLLDELGPEDL
jgi:hypothetical protein